MSPCSVRYVYAWARTTTGNATRRPTRQRIAPTMNATNEARKNPISEPTCWLTSDALALIASTAGRPRSTTKKTVNCR
jgi:hypothetical protein